MRWRELEIGLPAPRLAAAQVAIATLDWLLAAAVLFVLLPAGAVSFGTLVGAFTVAQIAGVASTVPAGLGVFETGILLMLGSAAPTPALLGSLVAYRLVYYLVPLVLAVLLLAAHEVAARRGTMLQLGRALGRWAPVAVPHALAVATFIAGAVLLVSGATPALSDRLGWLRDVEPHLYDLVFEDDAPVARSLVVSGEADASWWLLDPGDVDGRGEWRAGRWSSWNPGMEWIAGDFFRLFENEVFTAERLLAREQSPPPVPGAGRSRNELSVGDINSTVVHGARLARNGYTYVRAEGFASVVTASAPPTARVGEWVLLNATRRSGPWNAVRQEEVWPDEISLFEPPIFEREVAGNLAWSVEPPGIATFNTDVVAGTDPMARSVRFGAAGIYKLRGYSAFPLPVFSNSVTIRVE